MAFFSDSDDRRRLMLLYILKCSDMPLSREQLAYVMAETGAGNYLDISARLLELERSGYVASVRAYRSQLAVLTAKGEEAVVLFEGDLPRSLRESLAAFVEEHRSEFHRENTSHVVAERLADGGYNMTFALVDGGDVIFEMRLRLPNAHYAQAAERNWEDIAQELYLETLNRLAGRPAE